MSIKKQTPQLITIGKICDDLGAPRYRVEYVIRTRKIEPCATAGMAYIYDEAAVAEIEKALAETEEWSGRGGPRD